MFMTRLRPVHGPRAPLPPAAIIPFVHKFVWDVFASDAEAKRDFLWRLDAVPEPVVTLLSKREPVNEPDGWRMRSVPFDPQLEKGQGLAISARVNATAYAPNGGKRWDRHSVVLAHMRAHPEMGRAHAVQEAYLAWLKRVGARCGFQVVPASFQARDHTQVRFKKSKGGHVVTLDSADLDARIVVDDPARVERMLAEGIGRGRSYGMGLVLASRA